MDSQHATIRDQVFEFVANERRMKLSKLTDETDLYRDTGMYGDDVDEFFLEFCKRFGLTTEGNFLAGAFPGEGGCFVPFGIVQRLFPTFAFLPARSIRIKHLVQAAEEGVWPW